MSDVPEGYMVSEVGVIPEEWEVETLGDIFTFGGGYSASRDQLSSDGHCYLHYGDIHKSTKSFIDVRAEHSEIPKLNILLKHISPKSLLHNGDIVFVDASEDDEGTSKHIVVVNNENITYISGLHTIVAKSKVAVLDNEYKRYCFQSRDIKKQFYFYAVGTKVSGISKTNIAKLRLPIPPLPEQQAIASALSDVDALIAALEQLITKKRNIKQGAMQQLLTGKKRLPGFGGEWEVKKLGGIAEIQRGASPRPIDSPIWYDTKSKVGWVRISDVTTSNGKNLSKTKDYLSEKGISQSRFLPKNSLIMSICATVGVPVITSIETCIHDGFIGFSKLNSIDKEFLYYKLKELENSFKSMGQTGSQNNLNSDLVRNYAIKIPPRPEQQAIAQILSEMDAEVESLEQKRDKYKAIKQGMMQELLTGKTRLV